MHISKSDVGHLFITYITAFSGRCELKVNLVYICSFPKNRYALS